MPVLSRDVRRSSRVWVDLILQLRGVELTREFGLGIRTGLTATGAVSINANLGTIHEFTLTGNVTSVTFTNLSTVSAQLQIIRWIQQAGAGGLTVAFGAGTPVAILRGGGFNMTAAADRSCVQGFYYNGTNLVEILRMENMS